jgi:predicted DsbA family dithiol-disulfide isomerase
MSRLLRIDIDVDLVCPWCLIGLRNFQQARAELQAKWPDLVWDVRWRGVQLLPDVPRQGYPFHEFYLRRLGGPVALAQRQEQVRAAAEAAGVTIRYERIQVMPNTADGHRLLELAGRSGGIRQEALLERLLRSYFEDGEDIGRADVLLHHGAATGLDIEAMEAVLRGAEAPYEQGGREAYGVPRFTFNGAYALSGAQPVAALLMTMSRAVCLAHESA